MTPDDILLTVAAKNGKAPRQVTARFRELEFRDNLDTNSSTARERFVKKMAAKFAAELEAVAFVDSKLIELADAADLEAAQIVADEMTPRPKRPIVRNSVMLPGESSSITAAATKLGEALAATGRFYIRGGVPLRAIVVDGEIKLDPLRPAAACSDFESVADLIRMRATKDGAVEVSAVCSETTAKQIIESQAFRSALPSIAVLSRCPVLIERGGKLEVITGYDRASGIWAGGEKPDEMSLDDAKQLLDVLVEEFHFASDGDRSRALAAFITPALVFGGLLGGRAPIDIGEADQSQSGKGYRHKLTAAVYRNQPRTITQRERGVGSLQESFDAALVSGACFISFDNLRGKIESAGIESFMTESVYFARIPYAAPMEIDPTRTIVKLTTNKGEFTRDTTNRGSIVRIRKRGDDYQFRKFEGSLDLHEYVQVNQAKFLGAVFTVVKEWHKQGKPRLDSAAHDFRRWATTLGWIVENLLGAAPLVEGHRAIQERMSSPAGNWLRDLALAVRSAGKLGERLRVYQLLDIVVEAGIETPGISDDLNLEDEDQFGKAVRAIGKQMARVVKGDSVEMDDIKVTRHEGQDAQFRPVKEYEFVNLGTPQCEATPQSKRGTPQSPECAPTFLGEGLNTPTYKSVAPIAGIAGCGVFIAGDSGETPDSGVQTWEY